MSSVVYEDLKLNRNLINPNFGGYKLSLDTLPIYRTAIDTDLDIVKVPDHLYEYQHLKAFGVHNHIYLDPWNGNTVYFVDKQWRVMKSTMLGLSFVVPTEQYTIPDSANRRLIPDRVNVSLHFTSDSLLVLSDGAGRLFVIQTGDRKNESSWKVGYSGRPLGEDGKHFIILDSVFHTCDDTCYIEVLVIHVDSNPLAESDDNEPAFITRLEWFTLNSDNATTFNLIRTRRLDGLSGPDYAAILPNGSALLFITDKSFKFTFDSIRAVVDETLKTSETVDDDANVEPAYTWSQTEEDITITFKLPHGVTKTDVVLELKPDQLSLSLKDSETPLLCGGLIHKINVDASTWIITDNNVLEVHLTKAESALSWNMLVRGDSRGKMVFTEEQLAVINEQLDKFTTATENADIPEDKKAAFNTQQLEDCDHFPEDSSAIWCLDGETHRTIQQVNISSNQWLFNARISPEALPVVCLRHDVDGIVWQPVLPPSSNGSMPSWKHTGTFDAFGYVVASKQQRKFATCSPEMSFVVVADCVRHLYIYRRPTSIASPLRNRKTGETVSAVARQQLISLESTADIMGMRATNTDIFVLAGKTLYAVRVNECAVESC